MHRLLSLSLYWFLYLGALGIFFPYYSLYLRRDAGLTDRQIGLVQAMMPLTGIGAQILWGWIADRTGARRAILVLVSLGAAAGYGALGLPRGFGAIVAANVLVALFATAVGPMTMSVHLGALAGAGVDAFARVRVWGTVGFLAAMAGFPALVAVPGLGPGMGAMFPAIGLLMLAAALTACAHPPGGAVALKARPGEALGLARHGPTVRLCLFAFFSHLFLHGPMVLFPVYVTGLGGDETMVRDMWIPMLLIEIPLIRWMGPWTRRLGARSLLMAAVLAGGARWLVCGLTANLPLIFAVQLVHGLVVVGLAIGGPLYMEQAVPEQLRSTAQALYSIFSLGVGASTSAALFGEVLQRAGAGAAYAAGGAGALALGLLLPWLLPAPRPVDSPGAPAPAAVE